MLLLILVIVLAVAIVCEIWSSHGSEYEDQSLLGFIALMMELVRTSETSVYSNETTLRYIPEGCNLQQ
jgi:hypothetical protein